MSFLLFSSFFIWVTVVFYPRVFWSAIKISQKRPGNREKARVNELQKRIVERQKDGGGGVTFHFIRS